jgi:hypothetical protein
MIVGAVAGVSPHGRRRGRTFDDAEACLEEKGYFFRFHGKVQHLGFPDVKISAFGESFS